MTTKRKKINNMELKQKGDMFAVSMPTKIVGRHRTGYHERAWFLDREEAILFMKQNVSYISPKTRMRKSLKWIAIGVADIEHAM